MILTTTESVPITKEILADFAPPEDMSATDFKSSVGFSSAFVLCPSNNRDAYWNPVNSFIRLHEAELSSTDSFFETSACNLNQVMETSVSSVKSSTGAAGSTTSATGISGSHRVSTFVASGSGQTLNSTSSRIGSQTGSFLSSSPNSSNPGISYHSGRSRGDFPSPQWTGNSLGKVLGEFNQLTWFRFRRLMPCLLSALDYRLAITDDDHVQVSFLLNTIKFNTVHFPYLLMYVLRKHIVSYLYCSLLASVAIIIGIGWFILPHCMFS